MFTTGGMVPHVVPISWRQIKNRIPLDLARPQATNEPCHAASEHGWLDQLVAPYGRPQALRTAGIDVLTSTGRPSRLPSSSTFSVRNRRPPYRASCMKSSAQISLSRSGATRARRTRGGTRRRVRRGRCKRRVDPFCDSNRGRQGVKTGTERSLTVFLTCALIPQCDLESK